MARIAVVGVGAVGSVVAAALLQSGQHPLLLCARRSFERLIVEGPDSARTEVGAQPHTDPHDASPVETVLLATKAHQTAGTAAWLSRLCDEQTVVVVLQNGVEHRERVAPHVGKATIVPCIVDCPCTTSEPGHVHVRRAFTARLPDTQAGLDSARLLASAGLNATVTADCINVVSGPVPALCDQPHGVFRYPPITALARSLIEECVRVGRAEGARLELARVDEIVASQCSAPPDWITSMLGDRRAGRLLEADSRNGAVVRAGKRHGIPTPANAFAVAVLSAINRTDRERPS